MVITLLVSLGCGPAATDVPASSADSALAAPVPAPGVADSAAGHVIANSLPPTISDIQSRYAAIQSAKQAGSLQPSGFDFNCHGEKSGTVTFYRQNGQLLLIEKIYGEYSHREVTEQYFMAGDRPFFIYRKLLDWVFDSEAAASGATKDRVREYRFYLARGEELVRCLQKEYTLHSAATNNPVPEEVPSEKADCPPVATLLGEVAALLPYREQKEKLECLDQDL